MRYMRTVYRRVRYGFWLMMLGIEPKQAVDMVNDADRFGHLDY